MRQVSFVDYPGHEVLMQTMMGGVSVMDAALLLVSANETCPQPRTVGHLAAIETTRLNASSIIAVQNKVGLVGAEGGG